MKFEKTEVWDLNTQFVECEKDRKTKNGKYETFVKKTERQFL